jgi:hypothetical protein
MHNAGGVNGDRFPNPAGGSRARDDTRSDALLMLAIDSEASSIASKLAREEAVRLNGALVKARDTNRD